MDYDELITAETEKESSLRMVPKEKNAILEFERQIDSCLYEHTVIFNDYFNGGRIVSLLLNLYWKPI
jgi:hypothetical protein